MNVENKRDDRKKKIREIAGGILCIAVLLFIVMQIMLAGNRHRWDGERRVNGSFIFRSRSSLCLCSYQEKEKKINLRLFSVYA